MPQFIDDFASCIAQGLRLSIDSRNDSITIREINPSASLKKVTIRLQSNSAEGFCFDSTNTNIQNSLLNPREPDINKSCDGVILLTKNDINYVIFCELKSSNPKPVNYEKQLVNTHSIINYINNLIDIFKQKQYKLTPIFVLFYRNKVKVQVKPGAAITGVTTIQTHVLKRKFKNTKIIHIGCQTDEFNIININEIIDNY